MKYLSKVHKRIKNYKKIFSYLPTVYIYTRLKLMVMDVQVCNNKYEKVFGEYNHII